MPDELADQVAGVGALVEPARRALYLYVASLGDAVSREQAAAAVGVPCTRPSSTSTASWRRACSTSSSAA